MVEVKHVYFFFKESLILKENNGNKNTEKKESRKRREKESTLNSFRRELRETSGPNDYFNGEPDVKVDGRALIVG